MALLSRWAFWNASGHQGNETNCKTIRPLSDLLCRLHNRCGYRKNTTYGIDTPFSPLYIGVVTGAPVRVLKREPCANQGLPPQR